MCGQHHEGDAEGEDHLLERQQDQEFPTIHPVSDETADHRQQQGWAELGEDHDADVRARVGELEGIGTEHDVLHPGADVRGEGPEEDDPEGSMAEGGADGAAGRRNNGVTVDDSVLDLLEGDGRFDLGVALVVVVHVWVRPCAPPWNSGGPLKAAYDLVPPPTEMTIKVLRRIC